MSLQSPKKTTREIEQHYFEQFYRAYELPKGSITYGDKPDVLFTGERTIGIEITMFYRQPGGLPGSEQRQKPLRENIVTNAQERYRKAGGKNIEITVVFDDKKPIASNKTETLITELVKFVQHIDWLAQHIDWLVQHIDWLAQHIDWLESGQIEKILFQAIIPEVSYVYLNTQEYKDAKWRVMQSYKVENMSPNVLIDIVKDKESKSSKYKSCDDLWLLIVVDWIDPAQEQEIRIGDLKIKSDVFEKIIIYKPKFEHIEEVWP
ncbi:MAG: hypothetical protein HQL37_05225 [Alphaproteobacteria bacterium]|nr:hypothetical protein [Alphaproteobacteria bacterium]